MTDSLLHEHAHDELRTNWLERIVGGSKAFYQLQAVPMKGGAKRANGVPSRELTESQFK